MIYSFLIFLIVYGYLRGYDDGYNKGYKDRKIFALMKFHSEKK